VDLYLLASLPASYRPLEMEPVFPAALDHANDLKMATAQLI
jgi:hypothetical protein